MKTPPFLLGAALVFWGWQTEFLPVSILLALVLEGARLQRARWEFSAEDFSRIWLFCVVLFAGAAVFAFTANKGPADLLGFFENPNFFTQRNAGNASARTAASLIRWQPFIFFPFILSQTVSTCQVVPLRSISLLLQRRWKRGQQLGLLAESNATADISYPFMILCLFAASVRAGENVFFFCGASVLLTWALWPQRSPRFPVLIWGTALGLAVVLGYSAQLGIGQLRRWIESYSPSWLSRSVGGGSNPMRSKTALGSIGRLKGSAQIVIRVVPKLGGPPALLREASYRLYRSRVWLAGSRSDIPEGITALPNNQTTFVLLPDKTNFLSSANIACYLSQGHGSLRRGLLPVPEGSSRFEDLEAYTLQKNNLGDLVAEGPGLLLFDAYYGPGATIDSPPDSPPEPGEDLNIPAPEESAVSQVAAELHLNELGPEEALRSIGNFFRSNFRYWSWQERDQLTSTNETPLGRFLLRRRAGHCEYFATASVLLARKAKIPARYAVGYAVHELSGNQYVVRQRDAHAWAIVWNARKRIWQDFDTTPASWVETEASHSPVQALSDLWSRLFFEFSKFRWGQTHLRQYFLWALAPVLILLLVQILWQIHRQRRRSGAQRTSSGLNWPGLDSEFYTLERSLRKRGVLREPGESLAAWWRRASGHPSLVGRRIPAEDLLQLHYRYRFDPSGLDQDQRDLLRRQAAACLAYLEPGSASSRPGIND